jgi:hypothetical protein
MIILGAIANEKNRTWCIVTWGIGKLRLALGDPKFR